MPIRVTGMNSGLDTDSIIQELVKAASTKKTKLEKAQTSLSWKQDAWKSLNTKIHSFFKKTLSNLKFSDAYKKKTTTISDPSIASVVTADSAVKGSQSLEVLELARAGKLTGGKLITQDGSKATDKTRLSALGLGGTAADGASISITNGGKTSYVSFNADSTIGDVVNAFQSAGLSASFDQVNQRIFVNTTKSGKDNDFSITANNMAGLESLANLGLLRSEELGDGTEAAKWAKYKGATDADTLANLQAAGEITKRAEERAAEIFADSKSRITANTKVKKEMDLLEEAYENGSRGLAQSIAGNADYQALFANKGLDDLGNLDAVSSLDSDKLAQASKILKDEAERLKSLSKDGMTEDELQEHNAKIMSMENDSTSLDSISNMGKAYQNRDKLIADNNTVLADNADHINELSVDADGVYSIQKETAADGTVREKTKATASRVLTGEVGDELVEKANTAAAMSSYDIKNSASDTAVRIKGEDAHIKLDGADFESATNSFNVNGLSITVKEQSNGTAVNITTDDDTDGVFDMIKGFLTEYNALIKEMDSLYNAASSKGYEPLTSEEKDAMSDDEIKKWEDKIKDSVLRRDSTLGTVISSMKNSMLSSFTVGGKSMSLSDFGIGTLGYFNAEENEQGMFHIDGDPDDPNTSSEDQLLKGMIANNPQAVTDFFTQLTTKMYDELNKQMKSSDYRSVYHVYDDKKMKKEYDAYTKKIKEQEDRVTRLEDKYYKQFSVMETTLAKLEKSKSAVTSLLGG